VVINGSGEFDLRVTGDSALQYSYVGDTGAASGDWLEVVAKISEPIESAQFDLLTLAGEYVQSVDLNDVGLGGDLQENDGLYTGYYQALASGDYRLQLNGIMQGGEGFTRSDPRLIRIHNVSVKAPEAETIAPDTFHTFAFRVTNTGALAETYDLYASSGNGWIWVYPPSSITLGGGETSIIEIEVYVPADAYPNLIDNIALSAVYRDDVSIFAQASTAVIVPDVDTIHNDYFLYLPMTRR